MLQVTSVKKDIGLFSLSVEKMQIESPGIFGLIGPNACGKSTLAKLLCGILQPDSGKIETDFSDKEITMVTQKPYIMKDTVLNNLEYPLKIRGVKDSDTIIDEYLYKTNLINKKYQMARELSGGEKQKLAILRAMIFSPKLIILDESMTDLDLDSVDLFEELILERQKQSPAVWIIISHQLAVVRRLCEFVYFMANGRLETQGQTETVFQSQNPLVKRYLKHGFLDKDIVQTGALP